MRKIFLLIAFLFSMSNGYTMQTLQAPVAGTFSAHLNDMLEKNELPRDLLNLLNGISSGISTRKPSLHEVNLISDAMAKIVNDVPPGNDWAHFIASYNEAMTHVMRLPNNTTLQNHTNILYNVFEQLINMKQGAQANFNNFTQSPQAFSNLGTLKTKTDHLVRITGSKIMSPQAQNKLITDFVNSLPENKFNRPAMKQSIEQGTLIIPDARLLTYAQTQQISKMIWLKHVGFGHVYFRHNFLNFLGKLANLESLALVDCQFLEIPRGTFLKWKHLTSLMMDKCHLTTIPDEIAMTNVSKLSLRNNFIHRINNVWKTKLDGAYPFHMDMTNNYLNVDPVAGTTSDQPGSLDYYKITDKYGKEQYGVWGQPPSPAKITWKFDANYRNWGIADYKANIQEVALTLQPAYQNNNILTVMDGYLNANAIPRSDVPEPTLDFHQTRALVLEVFNQFQDNEEYTSATKYLPDHQKVRNPNYIDPSAFGKTDEKFFSRTFRPQFLGFLRNLFNQPPIKKNHNILHDVNYEYNHWDVMENEKPEIKKYLEYDFKQFKKLLAEDKIDDVRAYIASLSEVINCHVGQMNSLAGVANLILGNVSKGEQATQGGDFIVAYKDSVLGQLDLAISVYKLGFFHDTLEKVDRPQQWGANENAMNRASYQEIWWDKIGLGVINKATGASHNLYGKNYNNAYANIYKYYYEANLNPAHLIRIVRDRLQDYTAFTAFLHKHLKNGICFTESSNKLLREKFIPIFSATYALIHKKLIDIVDNADGEAINIVGWEPYFTSNPFQLHHAIYGDGIVDFGVALAQRQGSPENVLLDRFKMINSWNYPMLTEEGIKKCLEIGAFSEGYNNPLIRENVKPIPVKTNEEIRESILKGKRNQATQTVTLRIMREQNVDLRKQMQTNKERLINEEMLTPAIQENIRIAEAAEQQEQIPLRQEAQREAAREAPHLRKSMDALTQFNREAVQLPAAAKRSPFAPKPPAPYVFVPMQLRIDSDGFIINSNGDLVGTVQDQYNVHWSKQVRHNPNDSIEYQDRSGNWVKASKF